MQNRKPFRERYNKRVLDNKSIKARIRSSHYFYTERISMHVMADLSHRDEPATGGSADSETLLCSVIYDKARKQLTINPDFTIDDERHYSVTNGHGVKFNYWIEHVSAGPTLTELQEQCEATRRVSMRLFTTDNFPWHSKLPRHCGHRIKKIVFSWKTQSRHSRAISVYAAQLHLYPAIFSPADSSLFDSFFMICYYIYDNINYNDIILIVIEYDIPSLFNNFKIISHI